MLLSRIPASLSRRMILPDSQRVLFSTNYVTGTVKMYTRKKAYGFIVMDADNTEVFVHRSGIAVDVDAAASPFRPYLKRGEQVRFEVVDNPGKGLPVATDVTYKDGSRIPTYREGYVTNVEKFLFQRFGEDVFNILENGDEDQMDQILAAFENTKASINDTKENVSG